MGAKTWLLMYAEGGYQLEGGINADLLDQDKIPIMAFTVEKKPWWKLW